MTVKELTFEEFNRQNGLVYQGSKLINEVMIREAGAVCTIIQIRKEKI